jgi:N-formylglutamate deformylase
MLPTFDISRGAGPLVVSMPHIGLAFPPGLDDRLNPRARATPDADQHLDVLYEFLKDLDVTFLKPNFSRYVVDLNRPRSGESLYPGSPSSGTCPLTDFDGSPLYAPGCDPSAEEQEQRLPLFWDPYHAQLQQELDRVRLQYGYALSWDAHSIRSRVPRLFEGQLPDFCFGTNAGKSCSQELAARLCAIAERSDYSAVLDGRFKGGYITRHYGQPADNIHAVQLELSWATYLNEEEPVEVNAAKAQRVIPVLQELIEEMNSYSPRPGGND